jgi:hypothetical protein
MRVSVALHNNISDSRPKQHAQMSSYVSTAGRHATATRCLPVELTGEQGDGIAHSRYTDSLTCVFMAHDKTAHTEQFIIDANLTPRRRVLLEKLTVPQLLKKFPAFYGTRRFITAFTKHRHLSLS